LFKGDGDTAVLLVEREARLEVESGVEIDVELLVVDGGGAGDLHEVVSAGSHDIEGDGERGAVDAVSRRNESEAVGASEVVVDGVDDPLVGDRVKGNDSN
jgi:hypothetical protein